MKPPLKREKDKVDKLPCLTIQDVEVISISCEEDESFSQGGKESHDSDDTIRKIVFW